MKNIYAYIHIPFCRSRCIYCDFATFPFKEEWVTRYRLLLKREIELKEEMLKNKVIKTIYFGGGTPSLFPPSDISWIPEKLKSSTGVESKEITIEANPSSLDEEKIAGYANMGINRLSIGLQSIDDTLLEFLGRNHDYTTFLKVYKIARRYFKNINIDLLFGIPGQTLDIWKQTLNEVISLGPQHLSLYSLTVENDTILKRMVDQKKVDLLSEDIVAEMYEYALDYLETKGYVHYEISNWALPGYQCVHNIAYWKNLDYMGFGISASSHIDGKRFTNTSNLKLYSDAILAGKLPIVDERPYSWKEEITDTVFMGMRMMEGISLTEIKKKFGVDPYSYYSNQIKKVVDEGLVEIGLDRVRLTKKGMLLGNVVFREFL